MPSARLPFPTRPRFATAYRPSLGRLAIRPRRQWQAGLAFVWVASGILGAQTTFLGTWTEWAVPRITGTSYSVYVQPDPSPNYVFEYRPILVTDLLGNKFTQLHWLVWPIISPGQAGGTFSDTHWSNPKVWSDGLPDLNANVYFLESKSVALPPATSTSETPATARSLAIFATAQDPSGNYTAQTVTLSGGLLSLTPMALGESLRVGVSAAEAKARTSTLVLSGSTLTSSGIAMIGVGAPVGGGGTLTGILRLDNGAQWFHPAGLIEVGGGTGGGQLYLADGLLAGSILPGTAADPRVVVRPGSQLTIRESGSARLTELIVDSFNGYSTGDFSQGLYMLGTLTTAKLVLGQTTGSQAFFESWATTSDIGETFINHGSRLELVDTPAIAILLEILHGSVTVRDKSFLTLGNPAVANDTTQRLRMAANPNTITFLSVSGNDGDPANVQVHGAALLGIAGAATVSITEGATLDVRGKTSLGYADSTVAGSGTLRVTGSGSIFRTQHLEVGYSYFDSYSFNPYPSPTGSLTVDAGSTVEITGRSESYIFGGGTLTYNYAGEFTLGKNGTLTFSHDTSTLQYTDPSNGGVLNSQARLVNYGRIQGGGTAGSVAEIDFSRAGGGILTNHGIIAPGSSAGWLTINGDLTLEATSTLLLELGGTARGSGYDALTVTGALSAGGTLTVSLINGYSPSSGASFDLLDFGSLSGTFAAVSLPPGYAWNTDALHTTGVISLGAVPEPSTYALGAGLGALGIALIRRRPRDR
ncbi:MAG: PEP-CTERM sorting domain-containing protein [Verrucomicrobia bacterium]|nr:PEP-CTERM sorting domain-containing protein [Verrucomicrobiota bacterium]